MCERAGVRVYECACARVGAGLRVCAREHVCVSGCVCACVVERVRACVCETSSIPKLK